MENYENRFVLKRVVKSTQDDYFAALQIYMEETPKEIRTNSNEITHWLDKKTPASFEMLIFLLYLDNNLIGFSQITYIKSQQIVILDYISLKGSYRANSIFLVFLSMIKNYLISSGRQITYYIAEIGNKDQGRNIDRESAFYKRIICLENFGRVENKYYNLPLGIDNYESEFESLMYIKTNDSIAYISKETFKAIVHAISYDYYYIWYSDFLNNEELNVYKEKLDKYYDDIIRSSSSHNHISISYPACPLFLQKNNMSNFGAVPIQKKSRINKIILLAVVVFLVPVLLSLLYNTILQALDIQFTAVSTFFSGLIGSCITAYIAFQTSRK